MQISAHPLESELLCPQCGSINLHHDVVDVFDRREDARLGQHTHVPAGTEGMVIIRQEQDGNPSPRRHGIRIEFWCEGCHGRSSLCIAQHKGTTFLHWERSLEPIPGMGMRRSWQPFGGMR